MFAQCHFMYMYRIHVCTMCTILPVHAVQYILTNYWPINSSVMGSPLSIMYIHVWGYAVVHVHDVV